MKKSLYDTYKKEFTKKVSKKLENIYQLEDKIQNINIIYKGSNRTYELIINFKYSMEIRKYFQFSNGSVGCDMFIIIYLLHQLLIYIYTVQEKNLTKEEQDTISLEIETRFYFLLNCIYNIKEKLKKFFNISITNGKINFKNSVLTDLGKNAILNLFNKSYRIIEKYCLARGDIVHDIYTLTYNISKNEIYVSSSIFDFSEDYLIGKNKKIHTFPLEGKELISIIEEIQKMRKKTIEILCNINNINLEKLAIKFKNGKGYIITG